jgi:hypothetical protein
MEFLSCGILFGSFYTIDWADGQLDRYANSVSLLCEVVGQRRRANRLFRKTSRQSLIFLFVGWSTFPGFLFLGIPFFISFISRDGMSAAPVREPVGWHQQKKRVRRCYARRRRRAQRRL